MCLQHKSKMLVCREGKWEVGFEEYFEYINRAPFRLFFRFHSGTHGLFEVLGRDTKRDGSQECPNCGAC